MSEIWKPVPGYSGYEVSDKGRVRSVDRINPDGRRYKGQVLAQRTSNKGYRLVNLAGRTFTVHRLVLGGHAGPCPPGHESLHANDDPLDNRWPENLRWGTKPENEGDKFRNGARTRPVAKPPKVCVRCGGAVDTNGRRCHACVVAIGGQAAVMLRRGVSLGAACAELGYPSESGLHTLARRYGGYGQSRGLVATLRRWLRRGNAQ